MIETETLESVAEENELFPEDVTALRSEMWSKISEAVDLGVFTDKEAAEWEEGFEVCDRLEYMQNLIDIIDKFITSGLEVLEQLEKVLDTELFTPGEKTDAEWRAEILNYQDKHEFVRELGSIVKEVAHYKRQLTKILQSAHLPSAKSRELLQDFIEATADKKEGVVTRAVLETAANQEQSQTAKSQVDELISAQQFATAREILKANHIITPAEYAELVAKIDAAEITQVRCAAQVT